MPRLVIHVGLPKTGSTSVQETVFPYCQKDVLYAGKISTKSTHPILEAIRSFACLDGGIEGTDLFRRACRDISSEVRQILVSDEMLVVDTGALTWQRKLENLAKALAAEECEILVVVRDPFDALYSFYVETYHSNWTNVSFEEFITSSNQASLYKYGYLAKTLCKLFGHSKVKFVHWSKMLDSNSARVWLQESLSIEIDDVATVGHVNVKSSSKSGYVTNSKSLIDIIRQKGASKLVRIIPKRHVSGIRRVLSSIKVGSAREIEYPDEGVRRKYLLSAKTDLEEFYEISGIKFDCVDA